MNIVSGPIQNGVQKVGVVLESVYWDVSYMDTGLDAALSDSLDGMENLFNWLWSFSL